jgi:hypothetical protein
MAKVVAFSWFPRTHINLFETYVGLQKVDLKVRDVVYGEKILNSTVDGLSFKFDGYKNYPEITFGQGWGGMHFFSTELPDEGIERSADAFMKEMQFVLLEKILKVCHTVTYKNIVSDYMSLDFHTVVLTTGSVDTAGMTVVPARDVRVAYRPQDMYYGGTVVYVMGSDDIALLRVLHYHAYEKVASAFLLNMMKAMIRLFHNADAVLDDIDSAKDQRELRQHFTVLEGIINECSSRVGKMKHVVLNFRLKGEEFAGMGLNPQEQALTESLKIRDGFKRLLADGEYMDILWGRITESKIDNLYETLDLRLSLRPDPQKKGWF